jgi:hypothetical protein
MPSWPVNPIASMIVTRIIGTTPYSTSIVPSSASTLQSVISSDIEFAVKIQYQDPLGLGGSSGFIANIFQKTASGWTSIDLQTKLLNGTNGEPTTTSDTLVVSANMEHNVEQYLITLSCSGESGEATEDLYPALQFQAVLNVPFYGHLTLSYVPISIVYCPPGQDMTNSLTQSQSFGTRFSLGTANEFGWELTTGYSASSGNKASAVLSFDQDRSSQTVDGQSTDYIEISSTSNTIVTADNQKAIGRAFWGPLGDQFVIMANLVFTTNKTPKSPVFPSKQTPKSQVLYTPTLDSGEQVLVIPAWKLLRPGTGTVAGNIPAATRRSILALDPFITNLDLFFPDSGADLSEAANPYVDPSANNRAELISRWWLDTGTEIQYSRGNSYQQSFVESDQLSTDTSATQTTGATSKVGDWEIDYQESSETDAGNITNASCFLIKNQNDTDLDGIAIYFDKIFSTFMFQRLRNLSIPQQPNLPIIKNPQQYGPASGYGVVSGRISDINKAPLRGLSVTLVNSEGQKLETSTNRNGQFTFYNVSVGSFKLLSGNKHQVVRVTAKTSPLIPEKTDLTDVRRIINLQTSPVWEIADVLQMPASTIRKIGKQLARVNNERTLSKVTGADAATVKGWMSRATFTWTSKSRTQNAGRRVKRRKK